LAPLTGPCRDLNDALCYSDGRTTHGEQIQEKFAVNAASVHSQSIKAPSIAASLIDSLRFLASPLRVGRPDLLW